MKKSILLLVFWIFTLSVFSQTVTLDLGRSIAIASDSSLQAFRAKNLYMANYWQHASFKAGRLPSLTLKATPLQYRQDFTQRYDSDRNIDVYRSQRSLYTYGNLSVSQNFDLTGGTFFIDTELGYIRSFGDDTYSQFSSVPIRVGYSQSLFGFNRFKWEKKIEPLKYEKSKQQLLYSMQEISELVISYFFSLAMAKMEHDMAQENVVSSDTLYRIGEKRHAIASISQSDLLTLKLDAVNARNDLKNAEIGMKRAMFNMVSFLNMDKDTQVELELPERPGEVIIPVDKALQYAKQNNPDFMGYRQEILEAEREVEQTRKRSNFDASVHASVGFNQVDDNFREVYSSPLRQDVVSVGVTIPLLDWGVGKGQVNMARNNLNVTNISIKQRELALEQDIIMTVNDFNIRQDLIKSAEEALELANLAYKVTMERFIIGKADLSSLTLSRNRQNAAQRYYISTLRDYWLSYYKLRKLTLYDFVGQEMLTEQFDRIQGVSSAR